MLYYDRIIDVDIGGEVSHIFARKTEITLKISILGHMLLHKSYINVAIADIFHPMWSFLRPS